MSVAYPRALATRRMNAQGLSTANLLPLALGMANAALFGGTYAACTRLSAEVRVAVMAALFAAVVASYRALLPAAARFVDRRRERVVSMIA
jgi:hypothetical protein